MSKTPAGTTFVRHEFIATVFDAWAGKVIDTSTASGLLGDFVEKELVERISLSERAVLDAFVSQLFDELEQGSILTDAAIERVLDLISAPADTRHLIYRN